MAATSLSPDEFIYLRNAAYGGALVRVSEICFVESQGNYVLIHGGQKQPCMSRCSISSCETLFPASLFMRASRSHLINVSQIKSIQNSGNPLYIIVTMRDGKELTLSKSGTNLFRKKYSIEARTRSRIPR